MKKQFFFLLIFFFLCGYYGGASTANAFTFGKNKNWIKTEKGAVNLNNVNTITPVITSTITHSGDKEKDLFKEYRQTLSEKDVEAVASWFSPELRNEDAFYKLKVEAFLMLDLFRLNLFESETFVKKPKAKKVIIRTDEMTMLEYADFGRTIIFGTQQIAGQKAIGKGQCPLCHTFDAGDNIGRCPNLFGIGYRGATRVKEVRYLSHPIKVGEKEPDSGVIKGSPQDIPAEYRREGAAGHDVMTAEDYIRESMMCPGCYVVKGYGKGGDMKSPMPVSTKSPSRLTPVEVNAVIAYLQSYDKPGDYSGVTVPLPQKPIETVAALSGKSKIFSDKLAINDKKNKITQKKYKEIKDGLNTALKYYEDLINN
jgi:hypothetical protein